MKFTDRLQHAWNAFTNKDPTTYNHGSGYSYRPDRPRLTRGNERSIITSIYTRIGMDVAAVSLIHARLDDNNRFISVIDSGLNNCLNLEANMDQTGRAFIQDVVMSLLDEGSVAIVPIDLTLDPNISDGWDVNSMRTGKIVQWKPSYVTVRVYNEKTGLQEDIDLPKNAVGIIENPLYSIINEPNSTMQRLVSKLNLLDAIDQQSGSGKLDIIIQLPYVIKTEARRKEAEKRRLEMESQLAGSKYGVAYADGTEKITQLNRPVENNLMAQIEYLTNMLYSQLGITQGILDGTADEKTMLNYYNRSIEPFIAAIADEMKRKFLTKTARTQKQSIIYIRDPFKLVPVSQLADIADKFTRNEVLSSNDMRSIIGFKPSGDPKADELRNKNLNPSQGQDALPAPQSTQPNDTSQMDSIVNDLLDGLNSDIDKILGGGN